MRRTVKWLEGLRSPLRGCFDGTLSPWPYALLRVGLGATVLVRTTDWLRPWVHLDHHGWVGGLEYHPAVEGVTDPALCSPLIPLPALPEPVVAGLVVARTALAVALVLGVRPRLSAGALAAIGWTLMALDRYRYLHHLHLLWVACAWLALAPSAERASVERWLRGRPARDGVPRWPAQLIRLQLLVVYALSGVAKLDARWLSGRTLEQLEGLGLIGGPMWEAVIGTAGYAAAAAIVCGAELALVPLLVLRRTRVAGVVLGVALHLSIDAAVMVSTFTVQMLLLLAMFAPWPEAVPGPSGARRSEFGDMARDSYGR